MVLLAYSLGGRLALSLYQSAPELFSKVVLLAPDGLKMNAWYWFATQTWAGNKIFHLTMLKPGWFLGILKLANKAGLVNSSIFKFVNYYIGDPNVRKLLYTRWTGLRKCKPSLNKIRNLVPVHHTEFRLLYGKHDGIIRPSPGERFCKHIPAYGSLRILESGHQLLHPKYGSFIVEAILL